MMMQMGEEEEYGNGSSRNNEYYYVQSPSSSFSHHQQVLLLPSPYYQEPEAETEAEEAEDEECSSYYPTKPLLLNQHLPILKVGAATAIPPSYSITTNNTNNHNLSRCSSSRASTTTSLVHHHQHQNNNNVLLLQPAAAADHHHANNNAAAILLNSNSAAATNTNNSNSNSKLGVPVMSSIIKMGKVYDEEEEEEEEVYTDDKAAGNCWKYFSFHTYPSFMWIVLQLFWRFLLSVVIALLVFYLVTKPLPPHFSLKEIGVKQFEVTQGVDLTGVATNYVSCNISMGLIIDNRSKVFGLHTMPPLVEIYFARVPFVMSQGEKMYVRSREWREIWLSAGTNNKAMYGGGTTMEDMLNSETGLPLFLTLKFKSYITVLPNLIHSHFHHQAHCLLLFRNFNHHKPHSSLIHSLNTTCNFLTS